MASTCAGCCCGYWWHRHDVALVVAPLSVNFFVRLLLQAAQLLCSFREYHRRASFGLCAYYGQKLAAYEDALLNVREALFSVHQGPTQQDQQQQEDQLLKVSRERWMTIKLANSCMQLRQGLRRSTQGLDWARPAWLDTFSKLQQMEPALVAFGLCLCRQCCTAYKTGVMVC